MNEITKIKKPLNEIIEVIISQMDLYLQNIDVAIPYLVGPPGGGKTSMIYANFIDYKIFPLHLAFIPIEEISGLPQFVDIEYDNKIIKGTEWTLPDIISDVYKLCNENEKVLLFIDDFHLCTPQHMAYGYQLFTERKLRNYKLPKNCAILLAGNDSTQAGAKIIHSGIANRCCTYNIYTDFDYWKYNYALPKKINHKILTFLSQKQNIKYFHMDELTGKPWASPRSWTRFSNILNPMEESSNNLSFEDILYYATSHIGEEAAGAFVKDYKIFSQFDMFEIFNSNIDKIKIPEDVTNNYIFIQAAINELMNRWIEGGKKKDMSIQTICHIIEKIYINSPEICVAGLKEIVMVEKYLNLKTLYSRVKDNIKDNNIKSAINNLIVFTI